jgi:hypothetical protein
MQKFWTVLGAMGLLASPLVSAHAAMRGQVAPGGMVVSGTTSLSAPAARFASPNSLNAPPVDDGLYFLRPEVDDAPNQVNDGAFVLPDIASAQVLGAGANFFGFDGLSHYDQRFAGTGVYTNTQFSTEPPDQALAVGNGYVLEAVNAALAVYKTDGTVVAAPMPVNQFFGLAPAIIRSNLTFGPSLSDPRAYYDAPSRRFFVEEWGTDTDPATGAATGASFIKLAVSQTSNPAGGYTLYTFDTTFDPTLASDPTTGQPIHVLPDYVQIGADANGFFFSINQFDLLGNQGFLGQRILAVSKAALVAGTRTPIVSFSGGDLYNSPAGFTVQPATTPAGGAYETRAGGTEYFLSSVFDTTANQLAVWAISNTASLGTKTPSLTLTDTLISSLPFTQPAPSVQKAGPYKYGMSQGYPEELVATGDTRMTQVTYVLGHLYSAVETGVPGATTGANPGFTYFSVAPSVDAGGNVTGLTNRQGYVTVSGETLSYPSFGINSTGGSVITCALMGPDFYPSAAYVTLDSHLKAGPVRVASAGVAPDDGFTGYFNTDKAGNPVRGVARWGDYSQAQPDENGNIWLAQEMISARSNTQRSLLANYGTFISKITPTSSFSYKTK